MRGRQAQPELDLREDRVLHPPAGGRACSPESRRPSTGVQQRDDRRAQPPLHHDVAIYNDFTTTQGWAPEGVRFCQPVLF
jgi:hypothetical protein